MYITLGILLKLNIEKEEGINMAYNAEANYPTIENNNTNSTEKYRNSMANRRCKFCVYFTHIGPSGMPSCIPDAYKCTIKDKLVNPNDRRPFCKYYKLNKSECDEIEERAELLSKLDKEN